MFCCSPTIRSMAQPGKSREGEGRKKRMFCCSSFVVFCFRFGCSFCCWPAAPCPSLLYLQPLPPTPSPFLFDELCGLCCSEHFWCSRLALCRTIRGAPCSKGCLHGKCSAFVPSVRMPFDLWGRKLLVLETLQIWSDHFFYNALQVLLRR